MFKRIGLKKVEAEGKEDMGEDQKRKLFEIFRRKYVEDFSKDNCRNAPQEIEDPWCEYIFSFGCTRGKVYKSNVYPADMVAINCPDAYHRAYDSYYIAIPVEFAFKVLALGFLP